MILMQQVNKSRFYFDIVAPTIYSNSSKLEGVRQMKFLKPDQSSIFKEYLF